MGWFKKKHPQGSTTDNSDAPSVGPQILELNDAEHGWLAENLHELSEAGIDVRYFSSLGEYYDESLRQWTRVVEEDRADPNPVINRIGIGLGQHILEATGLHWVGVTDEYGTDIAIHGQPGNILLYPTNSVAKRWTAGEFGFIPQFVQQSIQTVTRMRQTNEK